MARRFHKLALRCHHKHTQLSPLSRPRPSAFKELSLAAMVARPGGTTGGTRSARYSVHWVALEECAATYFVQSGPAAYGARSTSDSKRSGQPWASACPVGFARFSLPILADRTVGHCAANRRKAHRMGCVGCASRCRPALNMVSAHTWHDGVFYVRPLLFRNTRQTPHRHFDNSRFKQRRYSRSLKTRRCLPNQGRLTKVESRKSRDCRVPVVLRSTCPRAAGRRRSAAEWRE
jgi:hypothetical protein